MLLKVCYVLQVKLSGSISSQYLSALLMAAPLALGDVEIEIIDKLISIPYVEMTLRLMERFGVKAEHSDSWDRFYIKGGQKYKYANFLASLMLKVVFSACRTNHGCILDRPETGIIAEKSIVI